MRRKTAQGNLTAFLTILIWGTTFVSTKVLLKSFEPVEILFMRFVLGLLFLFAICPRILKVRERKQEVLFALAGLSGVTLYYLMENIALTYTLAANVGVVVSVSPFFTAILSRFLSKEERLSSNFFVGFVVSMIGIFLISFEGAVSLNPVGDILALLAAFVWAVYSLLVKKISHYGYSTIQTTRRMFIYGTVFMIPALCYFGFDVKMEAFKNPVNVLNLLYLGIGASAICFVTWNVAVKILGAVRTSIYIYMIPVVTVIFSVIVLHEKITWKAGIGMVLILEGLLLSEKKTAKES